jgi:hypothetical protein
VAAEPPSERADRFNVRGKSPSPGDPTARSEPRKPQGPVAAHRDRGGWATIAAISAAIVGLASLAVVLVAYREAEATHDATARELDLLRQQVAATSRPKLLPTGERQVDLSNGRLTLTITNSSNAPTLGGVLVIVPPKSTGPNSEKPPPFPRCRGLGGRGGEVGHQIQVLLPPMRPGEKRRITTAVSWDVAEMALCGALAYRDRTGRTWVTDWSWIGPRRSLANDLPRMRSLLSAAPRYLDVYPGRNLRLTGGVPQILEEPPQSGR